MKIKANLHFNTKLEADLPDNGIMGIVNVDLILKKAGELLQPMLQESLKAAISRLSLLGVKIKILESGVSFQKDET